MAAPSLSRDWPVDRLRGVLGPLPSWRAPVVDGDLRDAVVTRAEAAAIAPIPALPAALFLEYARTGARAPYDDAHFTRRRMLRDLVAGEAVERAGRFLDRIVDVIWSLCEESWWGVPAHLTMQGAPAGLPDTDNPLVDLFAAETGATLGWTVRVVGDALLGVEPAIVDRVRTEVRRRLLDPLDRRDDFWWMGISDVGYGGVPGGLRIINNWNPWICSSWIACAVLLEDDPERRAHTVAKALRVLDQYLEVVAPDGSCEEGTAYWSRAAGSLFEALEMLSDATAGAVDVFAHPTIAEQARFPQRMQLAGPWFVNFGDGSPRPDVPAGVVYRFGRRIDDPTVTAVGTQLVEAWRRAGPAPIEALGRTIRTLEIADEASAATATVEGARYTWLPHDEVMVARDERGFALAARGGHNGAPHGHNDIGSFVVALDGEPVAIDPGIGTYTDQTFGPGRSELWTIRSGFHNVPWVGGTEQGTGSAFAAQVLECYDADARAELRLELSGAYPPTAGIDRWERRVVLERGNGVVVTDAWTVSDPGEVELTLMLCDEPTVTAVASAVVAGNAVVKFDPPPADISIVEVELDDPTLVAAWDRRLLWRIRASYADVSSGSAAITIRRVDT